MYRSGNVVGLPIVMLMVLLIAGCASEDEISKSHYGESVRHMIALQTSNPQGGAMGLDGQKAALTLQKYRTNVANPQEVDNKELGTAKATAGLEQ